MKKKLNLVLSTTFVCVLIFFSLFTYLFPGNEPQEMFDVWTFAHFTSGFMISYLIIAFIYKVTNNYRPLLSIGFALGLQLIWKIYEYVAGTTLFMSSLSNIIMDLFLGSIASILGVLLFIKIIMENKYGKN